MEITITDQDTLTVVKDKEGKIRLTINEICIVMPPMTAAIVCVSIQQILRVTYRKKRNTKRPQ